MLARASAWAHRHPSLFSGAWFATAALILASPLGAMVLLLLGLELLGGRPIGAYVGMLLATIGLPLLPAFGVGALVGPQILRLPPGNRSGAAGRGAAAALGALVLWFLLLEVVPRLLGRWLPATSGSGDVPGAAAVVGYLVVLPLMVLISLLVGAATGLLLYELAGGSSGDRVVSHRLRIDTNGNTYSHSPTP